MAQLLGVQEIAAYATEEGPAQGRKRKGEAEAFLGGEPQFLINARKRRATAEAEQLAMLDADGEDAPLPPPKLRPSPKRRAASAGKRRLPSRGRACRDRFSHDHHGRRGRRGRCDRRGSLYPPFLCRPPVVRGGRSLR